MASKRRKSEAGEGRELRRAPLSGRLTDSSRTSPPLRSDKPTGREKVGDSMMMRRMHKTFYFLRVKEKERNPAV